MSKKVVLAALIAFGGLLAGSASAGPIPAAPTAGTLTPATPSAETNVGESLLNSTNTAGSSINVDWMVIAGAIPGVPGAVAGTFTYFYQVENPAANTTEVNTFTVTPRGAILSAGVLAGEAVLMLGAYWFGA